MAEEKKDDKKEKKEPQIVSVTLAAGQVKNRQVPVTAFVALGRRELAGKTVYFYVGQDYQLFATSASGADGRAGALIDIPADTKGTILISAKAEGMPYPSSIAIDIEEQKSEIPLVAKLDIEPTGQWYDKEEASHYQWTPQAFDESGKAVEAKLHIVGARSFKINGLVPAVEVEKKLFDVLVTKEVKTYEIIIESSGLLEVDVFVESVDIESEFMLEGARPAKQPGFFTRRYLERRERRG